MPLVTRGTDRKRYRWYIVKETTTDDGDVEEINLAQGMTGYPTPEEAEAMADEAFREYARARGFALLATLRAAGQ